MSVRFGSVAASQKFNSQGAAYGQKRSFNDRARQLIIVRSISLAFHKISVKPLELGIEIEELV